MVRYFSFFFYRGAILKFNFLISNSISKPSLIAFDFEIKYMDFSSF